MAIPHKCHTRAGFADLRQSLDADRGPEPQIGHVDGKGLVAGIACVKPGTKEPDSDLAWQIVECCVETGVLLFSPVGFGAATVKIAPPLVIAKEPMIESLDVLEAAVSESIAARLTTA